MQATMLSKILGCSAILCALTGLLQQPQTVTVRGVVFDSLSMKPVAGAAVWVSGGTQIVTADSAGRFELRGVERGKRFVEFSSPALDSLELGTLGREVELHETSNTTVNLFAPSLATVWRVLCKGVPLVGSESGIVWGTIRDAATGIRLHGARATLTWTEPEVGAGNKVQVSEKSLEARTDSTGSYYACGVPVATNLMVQAAGTRSMSGDIQLTTSALRLNRLDLHVSSELVVNQPATDRANPGFNTVLIPRGTSTIRGVVRDDKQRVVADASITLTASDSAVITGADGSFSLGALPAGTHQVSVRKVGFLPSMAVVHLRPGHASETELLLNTVTELTNVDVKADAFAGRDRLDFEERRRAGFGYALDAKAFDNKFDLVSVLARLPNMIVRRMRGGDVSIVPAMVTRRGCQGTQIYIDGVRSNETQVSMIATEDFRGVEWYPRSVHAPARYADLRFCALILFWTRDSRWGAKR